MTEMQRRVKRIRYPINVVRFWYQRLKYRPNRRLSKLIARDVRREILVISTDQLSEGLISGRVRTVNLLYLSKGLTLKTDFGPEQEMRIDELWNWPGAPWGGLEDGSSITEHNYSLHNE